MATKKLTINFSEDMFNSLFLPYVEAEEEIQLFVGTAGSGKSVFNYGRAIMFALTKNYFRLVYCRKVATTIRDSMFQGFKDLIKEWNMEPYFSIKESEMDIICRLNGNMMLSFGLDDPKKLKSIKDPSHIMVDEMDEMTYDDFAQLRLRLRTTKVKQTQFWGMFNPVFGFWGREYFFTDAESDEIPVGRVPSKTDNTLIVKSTYKHNRFINVADYERKIRELARGDENYLTVYGEGNWGLMQTGNEFYNKFQKSIHVTDVPFLPGKPVHATYDFNVLPYMTELCAQINVANDKLEVRIFREYCLKAPINTTEAVCMALLEEYGDKFEDFFYYGDASGQNKIAGKGNVTAFDDVRSTMRRYIVEGSNRVMRKTLRY